MMLATLKAEFRKLLTIRSTYVILGLGVVLELIFAFYLNGYRLTEPTLSSPDILSGQITLSATLLSILIPLIAIFLISHEYRYNTILYTLTASRTRLRVFIAKIIVISIFSLVATTVFALLAIGLSYLGITIAGNDLVSQSIPAVVIGKTLAFGWAYAMLILSVAFIVRSQIGAIVFLFFFPGTLETLLGLLLKDNSAYLPFLALNNMLQGTEHIARSFAVAGAYIVTAWIVSAVLFVRRDAN